MRWLDRGLMVLPYLCLCLTEKDFQRVQKHLKIKPGDRSPFLKNDQSHATCHCFKKSDGKICVVVCMGDSDGMSLEGIYGLLVHEAVHVWQHFRDHIGEDNPSIEFEAYAIQTISTRLMADYKKQVSKK